MPPNITLHWTHATRNTWRTVAPRVTLHWTQATSNTWRTVAPRVTLHQNPGNKQHLEDSCPKGHLTSDPGNKQHLLEDSCTKGQPLQQTCNSRRKVQIPSRILHIVHVLFTTEIVSMFHDHIDYIISCYVLQQPNPRQMVPLQIEEVWSGIWDQEIKDNLTLLSEVTF